MTDLAKLVEVLKDNSLIGHQALDCDRTVSTKSHWHNEHPMRTNVVDWNLQLLDRKTVPYSVD